MEELILSGTAEAMIHEMDHLAGVRIEDLKRFWKSMKALRSVLSANRWLLWSPKTCRRLSRQRRISAARSRNLPDLKLFAE